MLLLTNTASFCKARQRGTLTMFLLADFIVRAEDVYFLLCFTSLSYSVRGTIYF